MTDSFLSKCYFYNISSAFQFCASFSRYFFQDLLDILVVGYQNVCIGCEWKFLIGRLLESDVKAEKELEMKIKIAFRKRRNPPYNRMQGRHLVKFGPSCKNCRYKYDLRYLLTFLFI